MTPFSPPSIADLTDRMLKARVAEPADAAEPEVEPYEVLNGFRTDPRTAYTDAVAALKLLGVKDLPSSLPPDVVARLNAVRAFAGRPWQAQELTGGLTNHNYKVTRQNDIGDTDRAALTLEFVK